MNHVFFFLMRLPVLVQLFFPYFPFSVSPHSVAGGAGGQLSAGTADGGAVVSRNERKGGFELVTTNSWSDDLCDRKSSQVKTTASVCDVYQVWQLDLSPG